MKPYIHATIIFAGFVAAAGAGSIISAEYHIAKTGRDAVATILNPRMYAPMTPSYDSDPYGTDVSARLNSELRSRQATDFQPAFAPDVVIQSDKVENAPLKLEFKCEKEQAKAERERVRAVHTLHSAQSSQSVPSASTVVARPMVASNDFTIPAPMSSSRIPKDFTFFVKAGDKSRSFRISPTTFVTPKGAEMRLVFDTKALASQHKQFVMQMKANTQVWQQMSDSDWAKIHDLDIRIGGGEHGIPHVQEIHIDPAKAVDAAQKEAAASLRDVAQNWSDEYQGSGAGSGSAASN